MVFREIEIEWCGETIQICPSMRLIRKIEQEVSLLEVWNSAVEGNAKLSHMAFVISALLIASGVDPEKAHEDEIYARLFSDAELAREAMSILAVALGIDPADDQPDQSEKKNAPGKKNQPA